MALRLLLPLVAAFALTACLSDVPDEPPVPATAATTATSEASIPAALSPTAASSSPTATARATSANEPGGTTGISRIDESAIEYDQACLSGEAPASTPSERLSPTQKVATAEYPGPYEPIPFLHDDALQSLLDADLGEEGDRYAYYVKDLRTDRGAVHNGEQVFNAASLFKLFVMYEVFHQQSLGLVHWEDKLVVTPYYDAFALSPRVTQLCQVLTVGDAMEAMLSVSDNAAAVLLQDLAGSSRINAAIAALGLQHSGLFEDGLPVTANDLGLLMEAIATGNAIGPEASADMLKLLDHDVFDNGLISGVPDGTVVSRKTGNWSDATNVAGVVYGPSGPYVFVALTSNGYETKVIRTLSSTAYGYFKTHSPQTGP